MLQSLQSNCLGNKVTIELPEITDYKILSKLLNDNDRLYDLCMISVTITSLISVIACVVCTSVDR